MSSSSVFQKPAARDPSGGLLRERESPTAWVLSSARAPSPKQPILRRGHHDRLLFSILRPHRARFDNRHEKPMDRECPHDQIGMRDASVLAEGGEAFRDLPR